MPKKKIYEFEGTDLIVRWDRLRCIHAEECVHGSPEVFDPDRRPWIEPDRIDANRVADLVLGCPTGALHYERKDGGRPEPTPETNIARVTVDGPIYVQGDIELRYADARRESENRVALCRCGDSRNKPFCDNSHIEAGFRDDGTLGAATMAPGVARATGLPVEISTAQNGPILIRGPIEIRSAEGTEVQSGDRAALCRCGASRNRPYCDGSHAATGFEAE